MRPNDAKRLRDRFGESVLAVDISCGVDPSHREVASFAIDLDEHEPAWSAFQEGKSWQRGRGTTHWVRPADFYREAKQDHGHLCQSGDSAESFAASRGRYHLFCKECRRERIKGKKASRQTPPIYDVPVTASRLYRVLDWIALHAGDDPDIQLHTARVVRVELRYIAARVGSAEE